MTSVVKAGIPDDVSESSKQKCMEMLVGPGRPVSNEDRNFIQDVLDNAMNMAANNSPTKMVCGVQVVRRATEELWKKRLLNARRIRWAWYMHRRARD